MPTTDEVAALMVGDGSKAIDRRDVIIAQQTGPFQCVSKLHVGYMALHYPLLFPYDEDGWHLNILLNGVVVDVDLDENHVEESEHQRKHYNVTMAKFYDYRLQHRDTDIGITLLRGDLIEALIHCGCLCGYRTKPLEVSAPEPKKVSCRSLSRPSRGSFYHLFS